MKIALFGGTFNPPHKGHAQIVAHLLEKGFNQIWIIPCWRHPMNKDCLPFWDRFHLCRLAFGKMASVRIKDIERRLHSDHSWTIDTVRYLCKKYPQHQFTLVLGQDNYEQRQKWKNFNEIERLISLYTVPRGPASFIEDVASQEIRKKMANGQDVRALIPEKVSFYCRRRGYFLSKTLTR